MPERTALVVSGGDALGAYHAGAWSALEGGEAPGAASGFTVR